MDALRAGAYRHLLYKAMLDIRNLCECRSRPSINPVEWYRRYHRSRIAGELGDWLHNLAHFSSKEFESFDEERFWGEHRNLVLYHSWAGFAEYRKLFDAHIEGRIRTADPPYGYG